MVGGTGRAFGWRNAGRMIIRPYWSEGLGGCLPVRLVFDLEVWVPAFAGTTAFGPGRRGWRRTGMGERGDACVAPTFGWGLLLMGDLLG